ncbi:MAG: hypothetical protein JW943_10020 [Deltaproteobacteria bacterium]|nr:hypothetical protein [Deltaproteobacteria bacterium]
MKLMLCFRPVLRRLYTQKVLFISFFLALLTCPCTGTPLLADESAEPWTAVTYKEWPDSGDYVEKGRDIKAERNARFGIDINSHVDIAINRKILERELSKTLHGGLSPQAKMLRERADQLKQTADSINEVMKSLEELFSLWNKAEKNPELWPVIREKIRAFSTTMGNILETLEKEITERLKARGLDEAAAQEEKDKIMFPVLTNEGYSWSVLTQLFQQEISFLDDELIKLLPEIEKLDIEIYAYLISESGGAKVPVHLPPYNEVKECLPTRVEKLTFHIPEEQMRLYEQHTETVQTMTEAKNLAEALLNQMELNARALEKSITDSFKTAVNAVNNAGDSIENLKYWTVDENIQTWISAVGDDLKNSPQGQKLITSYRDMKTSLIATYNEAVIHIDLLKSYAKQQQVFAGMTPESAMLIILREMRRASYAIKAEDPTMLLPRALDPATWMEQFDTIQKFLDVVNETEQQAPAIVSNIEHVTTEGRNPITDAKNAVNAIRFVQNQLTGIEPEVRSWIGKVLGLPPVLAAVDLEPPATQKRLTITQDLDTLFDLKRICGERKEFDTVRVYYRFFKGSEQLNAGWYNDFQLRLFGWQDDIVAGISFANQSGTSTFKPIASLSWILNKNRWPKILEDGKSGSGVGEWKAIEWFSGAGITTMPLDFDQNQDAEIGFAFTLSFINKKILVGYGANLQAENDPGFWFFSITLLDTPGMISPTVKRNP